MDPQTHGLHDFETTYRNHVAMVVAGDHVGVMTDMLPSALPTVFKGVDVPRGTVLAAEIVDARVEGSRAVGEVVYSVEGRQIGLRSGWQHDGRAWRADCLENFEVQR